jgi:uncharacterized protein YjbI with pentapeptide repeats/beta-lactamase regulating signal transducer with metallopeptidase domain
MNALEIVASSLLLSVAASGLLAAGCALIVSARRLRAGVAQWLWFCALVVIAALPVAGIASALIRSHAVEQAPSLSVEPNRGAAKIVILRPDSAGAPASRAASQSNAAPSAAAWSNGIVPSVLPYAIGILAAGALAGLAGVGISLLRLRAIKARSTPLDEALSHDLPWLSETVEGRETYLRLSYEIETPIAIGFGRPVILIPTDLANENGLDAIEALVIHEHAHLRHYDDYTNLVQRVIERLNWFNPFVWYMGRRLTLAREMAADDAVLERGNNSADYAQTLWRMAREMRMPTQPIVAPGAFFTRKQISKRIEAILSANRGQLSPLDPTAATIGLTLAFVAYGLVAYFTPSYEYGRLQTVTDIAGLDAVAAAPSADPSSATEPPAPPSPSAPHAIPTIPPSALGYIDNERIAQKLGALKERLNALRSGSQAKAAPSTASGPDALAAHCTSGCDLSDKDFSGMKFDNGNFGGSDLSNVKFRGASLRNVGFEGATLDNAHFEGADLTGARFNGASVDGTHFENAKLAGATFVGTDLSSAHFDNQGLRDILSHGCSGCDLSNLDLHGIDLSGVSINGTNLSNVNLAGANLRNTKFNGVNLSNAKLDNADLTEASFTGCDLSGVSTKNAKMERMTLRGSSFN